MSEFSFKSQFASCVANKQQRGRGSGRGPFPRRLLVSFALKREPLQGVLEVVRQGPDLLLGTRSARRSAEKSVSRKTLTWRTKTKAKVLRSQRKERVTKFLRSADSRRKTVHGGRIISFQRYNNLCFYKSGRYVNNSAELSLQALCRRRAKLHRFPVYSIYVPAMRIAPTLVLPQ